MSFTTMHDYTISKKARMSAGNTFYGMYQALIVLAMTKEQLPALSMFDLSRISEYDIRASRNILEIEDVTFSGVLMGMSFVAGTDELTRIAQLFPEIVAEGFIRYNGPGGALNLEEWVETFGEPNSEQLKERIAQRFAELAERSTQQFWLEY